MMTFSVRKDGKRAMALLLTFLLVISVFPFAANAEETSAKTTEYVNLRSGPGTSYDKVTTVSLGSEVQAAAKQDGWTFVSVDGKFGWINSDFLSTTRPAS